MPKVSVALSGKGKWKESELDADVILSASFGCCHVWFNLPVVTSSEPLA